LDGHVERFGPTRRGGPVFRWLGEPVAIDLANTVMVVRQGEEVDLLATPEDLRRWLEAERSRLGDCSFAVRHFDEIRAFRNAVRSLLVASAEGATPQGDAVERVNAASAAAPVAPQLELGRGGRFQTVERACEGDRLAQLLGILARSAIALLTGAERDRLRVCRAPSCGMVYLGERRWCCAACGNRARAARHYRRTRTHRRQTRHGAPGFRA
jgi:predicted RNA-binding Zn ribbon-like protein